MKRYRELAGGVSQREIVSVISPRNSFAEIILLQLHSVSLSKSAAKR